MHVKTICHSTLSWRLCVGLCLVALYHMRSLLGDFVVAILFCGV
jgi:hypothetical protein